MTGITLKPIEARDIVIVPSAFVATLDEVETQIAALKVVDAESAQDAAAIQQRLTIAGSKLEAARKAVKEPFLAKCKEIDAAAKGPADRIEKAKTQIKTALIAYDDEQRRIAAEAEAKRVAELKRLEEQRKEEERKQAEALAKNEIVDLELDDVPLTPVQQKIEALTSAPAVVPDRPVGISYRVRLHHTVVDLKQLPEKYVTRTANDAAIRVDYCTGYKDGDPVPEVAGVKFEVRRDPIATGKVHF